MRGKRTPHQKVPGRKFTYPSVRKIAFPIVEGHQCRTENHHRCAPKKLFGGEGSHGYGSVLDVQVLFCQVFTELQLFLGGPYISIFQLCFSSGEDNALALPNVTSFLG